MAEWIVQNAATLIIAAALAAAVVLIVIYLVRSGKKKGCGSCADCPMWAFISFPPAEGPG